MIRKTILRDGFAVLRGVLDVAQLERFRREAVTPGLEFWRNCDITDAVAAAVNVHYGQPWGRESYLGAARDGHMTDRMLRHATGRSYYELLTPALWPGLCEFGDLRYSVVAHCRAIHPSERGGAWSTPVDFHYDYWYHPETLFALNVWCPFDPVGTDAPTLRFVRQRLRRTISRHYRDGRKVETNGVDGELVPIVLAPGDCAIFTNWTLHQTFITPEMTRGRLSAEIRLCGQDRMFNLARMSPFCFCTMPKARA